MGVRILAGVMTNLSYSIWSVSERRYEIRWIQRSFMSRHAILGEVLPWDARHMMGTSSVGNLGFFADGYTDPGKWGAGKILESVDPQAAKGIPSLQGLSVQTSEGRVAEISELPGKFSAAVALDEFWH